MSVPWNGPCPLERVSGGAGAIGENCSEVKRDEKAIPCCYRVGQVGKWKFPPGLRVRCSLLDKSLEERIDGDRLGSSHECLSFPGKQFRAPATQPAIRAFALVVSLQSASCPIRAKEKKKRSHLADGRIGSNRPRNFTDARHS